MKITLVTVGRLREEYWRLAVEEYTKRLSKFARANIVETPDEKAPESLSALAREAVKKKEGQRVLKAIPADAYVVALAIEGKEYSSEGFSDFLEKAMLSGKNHFVFLIGASLGLSEEVQRRADAKVSFSRLTFPHQMMRVVLLEQVYRAMKILHKEPYHK